MPQATAITTNPPTDITPAEEMHCGNFIRLFEVWKPTKKPNSIKPTTWEQYVDNLPEWDRSLIKKNIIIDHEILLKILREGNELLFCSDGGADNQAGSYGSAIAIKDQLLLSTAGRAFGLDPQSFRAEAYGMLANLRLIFHITTFYEIPLYGNTKLYCDNKGLIALILKARKNDNKSPRRFLTAEIDIEMQIIDTMQQLQMEICEIIHVPGHQDEKETFENLTWESKMNVYCDQLATKELIQIKQPSRHIPMLPASRITLKIHGYIITHHIPRQIQQLWGKQQQRIYLSKHHKWTLNQFEEIDWQLFRITFYKFSFKKKLFIIKWINKILPLNKRHYEFNMVHSAECPSRCQCPETESHFLRCPHIARKELYDAFIKQLP